MEYFTRNDSILDNLTVLFPIFTIFRSTLVIVSSFAMKQKDTEINGIKVRNRCSKSTR